MKMTYWTIGNIFMDMGALFFAIKLFMTLEDMSKLDDRR